MFQEFKAFIARGSVVDLAVGIIIGAAFTAIVNSLVADIIMPPIGFILGGIDFSSFYVDLSGKGYENLDAARTAGAPVLAYGIFVNAIIKFLIVAWAVFILVKQVNRFYRKPEESPAPTPPNNQEVLLAEIRDLLKQRG
ncbi:MAG: large conductance mechanosensitive channel protein MscL [Alphaproteobacteria bacterium]|nr:large conductance mechanosensitive channel protein MscL [Alphaproteobacteria bacterium]